MFCSIVYVLSYSGSITCEFWKFLYQDILLWFSDFHRIITFPCFFTDSSYIRTPLLCTLSDEIFVRGLLPNSHWWTAVFRTLSSVSLIQLWCRSKYGVRERVRGLKVEVVFWSFACERNEGVRGPISYHNKVNKYQFCNLLHFLGKSTDICMKTVLCL